MPSISWKIRQAIEAHIRRRLRSRIIAQQKRRRHLYRHLVKRGVSKLTSRRAVFSNRGRWKLSNNFAMTRAYPVRWFIGEMGQKVKSDQGLPHWFAIEQWIKLM